MLLRNAVADIALEVCKCGLCCPDGAVWSAGLGLPEIAAPAVRKPCAKVGNIQPRQGGLLRQMFQSVIGQWRQ